MESGHVTWQLEWYHGIIMLSSLILEARAFLFGQEENQDE